MKKLSKIALLLAMLMCVSFVTAFAVEGEAIYPKADTRDVKLAYLNDAGYGDTAYSATRTNSSMKAGYDCSNSALSSGTVSCIAQRAYVNGGYYVNWSSSSSHYANADEGTTSAYKEGTTTQLANWRVKLWVSSGGAYIANANAAIRDQKLK